MEQHLNVYPLTFGHVRIYPLPFKNQLNQALGHFQAYWSPSGLDWRVSFKNFELFG